MKKVIIILISLFILVACGNKETKEDKNKVSVSTFNSEKEENNIDSNTINKDIDVWYVDPIYRYDDIDVRFTCKEYKKETLGNSAVYFNSDSLYNEEKNPLVIGSYEEGGLMVYDGDVFGILSSDGEIRFANRVNDITPDLMLVHDDTWGFYINSDYTFKEATKSWGIGGVYLGIGYINTSGDLIKIGYDGKTEKVDPTSLIDEAIPKNVVGENACYILYSDVNSFMMNYDTPNDIVQGNILITKQGIKPLERVIAYDVITFTPTMATFAKFDGYDDKSYKRLHFDYTYINLNGDVIASGYDDGYGFYEGYAPVKKDGKWGYINEKGELVVDFIFDKATPISDGKSWVIYKGATGRLNIIDMINNNVPFNDETLKVDSYKPMLRVEVIADNIKIRKLPSTSGEHITKVIKGQILHVMDKCEEEGYTWYKIGKDMWIADNKGEWLREIN